MTNFMNIDDYIKKYSNGIRYTSDIREYVQQTGTLPEYYINTTAFLSKIDIDEINIYHIIDVLDTVDIVRYKVKEAYLNLWKYLDGDIFDDEELLGISTIALGIDNYISYHKASSYEIFKKDRRFFEDWLIYKFALKTGDNEILRDMYEMRDRLAGFPVISYNFMSILGISDAPISSLN